MDHIERTTYWWKRAKAAEAQVQAVRRVVDAPDADLPTITINDQIEYPDGFALRDRVRSALDEPEA